MRIQSDGDTPPSPGEPQPQKHRLQANPTFTAVNPPAAAPGTPDPNDVHAHFRSATGKPAARPTVRTEPENDAQAIVRAAATAQYVALNNESPIESAPRRSRRTRDFFILLVGGNAVIAALMAVASVNPVSLIFGFAGMVVFTAGLSWVVFGIMERY